MRAGQLHIPGGNIVIKNFYFTRLIVRATDEGVVVPNAVVVWLKYPYVEKYYRHYSTFDFAEEPRHISYISKYRYGLSINLWLIKVTLSWLGREQKEPHGQ